MTYFLLDPIPALCDKALAHYSSALQNHGQEGGKLVRWVAIGMLQTGRKWKYK